MVVSLNLEHGTNLSQGFLSYGPYLEMSLIRFGVAQPHTPVFLSLPPAHRQAPISQSQDAQGIRARKRVC